ncbi:MAG: heparinase II/III family protein [Oscillospiraceae bacterium]
MINKNDIFKSLFCEHLPLMPKANACESPWIKAQLAEIAKAGEDALHTPIPSASYSLFKQHWITGDRIGYQKPYYEKRRRLLVLTILLWQNKDNKEYLTALEDIVWSICGEPYWCLPAHFLDAHTEPLSFSQYDTQIDLFAAETGLALSEMLELCEDVLEPQLVYLVKDCIEKRILTPFCSADTFFRFEGMANNWSAVCAGAVGAAAIYRVKDNVRLAAILHRCMSCMEVYLGSFGGDGVCVEGVDYWSYGFGFFTVFADLLKTRTNGTIDLFKDKRVEAIAQSQGVFYLGKGGTLSFSDGNENGKYRMGLSCYLAKKYPECILPPVELAAPVLKDSCYRFCLGIRDILWYDESVKFTAGCGGTKYYQDAKWFILQRDNLALAAKGGNNGESHNHNDAGSFIVAKNGVQLLCDFGAGKYDAKYFSDERYSVFINTSFSHNLPIINGKPQSFGAQFACTNEQAEQNSFSLDISGCYQDATLEKASRIIKADENAHLSLCDDFEFNGEGSVTEVFATLGNIELSEGTAIFTRGGETLSIGFDKEKFTAEVKTEQFQDHCDETKTASLLHLTAKTNSKNIGFCAEII